MIKIIMMSVNIFCELVSWPGIFVRNEFRNNELYVLTTKLREMVFMKLGAFRSTCLPNKIS